MSSSSSSVLSRKRLQVPRARFALQRAVLVGAREMRPTLELRFWEFPVAGTEALERLPIARREAQARAINAHHAPLQRLAVMLNLAFLQMLAGP